MKKNKKINCIIDCDPGVDDTAAVALSLYDDIMDIKLITTVCGNLDVETVTRNALHVLEKFDRKDIPLAKGAPKAMYRVSPDAKFIHQNEGMGNYIPPKTVKKKPIKKSAVEAMYETIKKYKDDISIVALGPHTNLGHLLTAHPDVALMVNHIYCEGCSPYGHEDQGKRWMHYISFNASSDPEAMNIVFKSGIPITIIPSRMGRDCANFTEEEVNNIGKINDVGRFIYEMYSGYWEHGYEDKRIAINDSLACLILRFPKLFKTKRCFFTINTTDMPGRTDVVFDKKGDVELVVGLNKKKIHKDYYNAVKKLERFKFYKK